MGLDNMQPVSLLLGIGLGAIFFGGLWWTVQRVMAAQWTGLWFFASLLLRTGIVLGGFYLAGGDDWQRWLAALLGFVLARLLITRLTRQPQETSEGHHASQS